jgi:heme exporter protein D
MDKATGAFTPIYNFIHMGFNDVRTDTLAIIIAFIFAFFLMKRWGQLIVMAIGATLVSLILNAMLPLLNHGKLMMPDVMAKPYWMGALALLVGYLILLIIFFFLKNNVFKVGKGGDH